jgi:Uma2 family endonuclease
VRLSRNDIVRPDLTGFRRERLPDPWDVRPIDVVPDWVCEVLSPSNVAVDRVHKAALYAERGVPFLWLVSPQERPLEAFRLDAGLWTRVASHDDKTRARILPFEAVELELGLLCPPVR